MGTEKKITIADVVTKDWLNKKQFASELGTTVNNLNQLLMSGPKKKKDSPGFFPKPGPRNVQMKGGQNVYNPEYVELVSQAREGTAKRSPAKSALKHAKIVIKVPIFDEAQANFLIKKFGSESAIDQYLRDKLSEVYMPVAAKLKDLEEKYQREVQAALAGI